MNCTINDRCPLHKKKHVKYLKYFLNILPTKLESQSTSRLLHAFFSLSGLDILNALNEIKDEQRENLIKWIYSLQIIPVNDEDGYKIGGFKGGATNNTRGFTHKYEKGHLAMTYAGLVSLVVLGDDLSGVHKEAILTGVKLSQNKDGSFCGTTGEESDMRFVYCACCICYILNDFSHIDLKAMANFIVSSISYDGGIGQGPHLESHGGSTFCALAALNLCNQLENTLHLQQLQRIQYWCISRQVSGFQGRPNKPVDTCYSFWVGASLHILDIFDKIDHDVNREYIMSTQDSLRGGFSKWQDSSTDPLHTHLGLCGLALIGEDGLSQLEPSLNVTTRAHNHLKKLHQGWSFTSNC